MNVFQGRIDLHIHTTISDGTDSPEEIIKKVKKAGIGLFSVTDHDAVNSGKIICSLLQEGDPHFLPGVEFSCKDELGRYHVLGYGYDPADSGAIPRIAEEGHVLRMRKLRARLDHLKEEYGITFPEEDIKHLFAQYNPGKPHLAKLMVQYGYAETIEQAIRKYINSARFRSHFFRPEEVIRSILAGGGIPVLAHPVYGSGDQLIVGEELEERLKRLIGFGLQGVEGFYSGFSDKLCREVLGLAEKYHLYVTAGSDYHGTNKLIELGDTGIEKYPELPEGYLRFLEDTESRWY